jgi:hypothetical protein
VKLRWFGDGHDLGPETFLAGGEYNILRHVISRQSHLRLDCELNAALPPSASDPRELGIIVAALSAED